MAYNKSRNFMYFRYEFRYFRYEIAILKLTIKLNLDRSEFIVDLHISTCNDLRAL